MAIDKDSFYIAYLLNDVKGITAWFNSTALDWSYTYPNGQYIYPHSMSILSNGDLVGAFYA